MSTQTRRRRREGLNIWPGFVDALATLVMVIVFVLMIFTLFQFHLKDMISGRDQALDQLSRRVGELADQLALERRSATDLRDQVNLLTGELTSSVSIRERLQSELAASEGRLANIETALSSTQDRARELERLLTTSERRGQDLDTRLAARDAETRDLSQRLTTTAARARDAEGKVILTEQQAANLARQLAAAETRATANETRASDQARRAESAEAQARNAESKAVLSEQQAAELARRLAAAETKTSATEAQAADLARRAAESDARARDAEGKVVLSQQQAADLARRLAAAETRTSATEAQAADLARRAAESDARARDAEGKVTLSQQQAADLARRLAAAETKASATEAQAADLARRAAESAARARDIEGKVTLTEQQAADLVRRLAAAETRAREADSRLEDAFKSIAVDREKVEVQLRELDALRRNIQTLTLLRDQLERDLASRVADGRTADQALAAERRLSSDAQLRVDLLTRQLTLLQQQLGRLESALDASESKTRDQEVQIVDLGRRLNMALASKVEELARYRSEFFGRLREALGDRSDVRVVGDRFIFETEVLFESGSAALQPEGRRQIERVAAALREITDRIPSSIGWILQVDGHTDRRPVVRSFQSNWELSHARAMSVVRALIAGGIPSDRLAAAGYAEFQPLDPRDDEGAYRRNRRIELKLTDR